MYLKIQSNTKASTCLLIICFIFIQVFLIPNELLSNVKWRIFGNLNANRQLHSAVSINKTEILVIGGYDNTNLNGDLATCEIIDIATGSIRPGPSMNLPRSYFAILVTKDTNIIVISGCTRGFDSLTSTVEVFNRITKTWSIIGNLKVARWQHCVEFLNDHEILVIGGRLGDQSVINNVEIFDINTGQSRLVNPFTFPTSDAVCGTTSNGKIISLGGREGGTNSNRSKYIYEYDLINDNWKIIDSVNNILNMPTMIKLIDNRLLMIGGIYHDNPAIVSDEVYSENNGQFTNSGKVLIGRFRFPMVQYNNDSVLVIGGYYDYNKCTNKCEWYNVSSNITAFAPDLNFARYNFSAVTMPDPNNPGKNVVLAIGGNDNNNNSLNSVEILRDSFSYNPPQITESSSDCNNFYFTVVDSNQIDSVQMTGFNQNVTVSAVETLPSNVVHVIVSLVDKSKNGYFDIKCTSNKSGLSINMRDTIFKSLRNVYAHFPTPGAFIFVFDTIAGAVKCENLIIENNGSEDISIDSALLYFNSEFIIPGNQLPLIVKAGMQKQLTICFKSDFTGFYSDTLYLKNLCDKIPLTLNGTAYDNKPTEIKETATDCEHYYITATDSNFINRVELSGSNNKNVKITIIESLPSRIVHVIITLIDPGQEGNFTVTFYCTASNKSVDIGGKIFSKPSYLLILDPVTNGVIDAGHTEFGDLKCINVLLQNTGSQELVIDYVRLERNIEFSIPQYQLPVKIPPGGREALMICYLPSELGEQLDTLHLNDLCDTITIPVRAVSDTAFYYGNSSNEGRCIVPIKGKTQGSWKSVIIGNPYPNPGNSVANVDILTYAEGSDNTDVSGILINNLGNTMIYAEKTSMDNIFIEGKNFNKINLTFKICDLSSGMYFIQIFAGGNNKILPYSILR